ncbi:hypothetical protein B566_EDAN002926 [Ephemera danica]|nr:hypothetical protein B566_EDAN002926 [Ephemera danica]
MDRLPLLPGFVFNDPSENRFHVPHTLNYRNGYAIPQAPKLGIGQRPLDADSVAHLDINQWCWDPSLTYGDPKPEPCTAKAPKYAEFANKTLGFQAHCIEPSPSPLEAGPRVRHVQIFFHLEDDTMSVMEPPITVRNLYNSGFVQGKMIRRHRIPKTPTEDDEEETFWQWKDLNVGFDIWLYGKTYHLARCDVFTREFLTSQGIIVGEDEDMPEDPYTAMQKAGQARRIEVEQQLEKQREVEATAVLDKLGRFLVYDRQVLRFYAVLQGSEVEGETTNADEALRRFRVLLYLADGSLEVRPEYEANDGHYHFPKLLSRRPLPRERMPVDFPSLSATEADEFYGPQHLRVGETIDVLGRKLFLFDCDSFTRDYYARRLGTAQPEAIPIEKHSRSQPVLEMPPHTGFGSPEDSLQSCLHLVPRVPRPVPACPPALTSESIETSERPLRYALRMDTERPNDQNRRFVLIFEPRRGVATINELPGHNTGITSGRFLGPIKLVKQARPGSPPPIQPRYYGPQDFGIGEVVVASGQRFVVTSADLYVLRWLSARRGHFPPELENNLLEHLQQQGIVARETPSA